MSSVIPLHPVPTQGVAAAVRNALNFPHTDVGNATLFVHLHNDSVRYATDTKAWYAYKNGYWTPDAEAVVQELAKGMSAYLGTAAANGTKEQRSWAKKTGEAKRVSAIIKLASSDPAITCEFADFDCDPMLLGVANGVVDLRTGAFRPALPSDLLTLRAPVEYVSGADCPLFKQFLRDICCDDRKLMVFVFRILAYCLTGDTREQKWFFLHGEHGSNGKSTLLRVLTMLLGSEMVVTVPEGFFTTKKAGYSSDEAYTLASLARARVAVSPELGENEKLAETRMKMMTGQDPVPARAPYGKPFNFQPHFKILQLGNDIPNIYGTGDAIWRRTLLVPFNATFRPANEAQPGDKIRINNFEDQLAAELPGILNLLIKQCVKWQRLGLRVPPAVLDKVAENRVEQDTLGEWLSDPDQVEIDPTYQTKSSALHKKYAEWALDSRVPVMSSKNFKKEMERRGFKYHRDNRGRWFSGIRPVVGNPDIQAPSHGALRAAMPAHVPGTAAASTSPCPSLPFPPTCPEPASEPAVDAWARQHAGPLQRGEVCGEFSITNDKNGYVVNPTGSKHKHFHDAVLEIYRSSHENPRA